MDLTPISGSAFEAGEVADEFSSGYGSSHVMHRCLTLALRQANKWGLSSRPAIDRRFRGIHIRVSDS
jgi:hypothetical protein